MRTARLVALSPDGRSLIAATDEGEEFAVPVDDRLRAAVNGDRPRLGQLEIQMDSSFSPRDIQARIRSGASLEEVAAVAGLPIDRVERFAAPVLAERDHVASTAASSSVRRRGETSGHRGLRVAVAERLHAGGVDVDSVTWNAHRNEDGRWSVTAAYRLDADDRRAEFLYDPQGRFSVAGNDEARSLLGERSPTVRPVPSADDAADAEPTVDLDDELALVRATLEPSSEDVAVAATEPPELPADPAEAARREAAEPTVVIVRHLTSVTQIDITEVEHSAEGAAAEDQTASDPDLVSSPLEVLDEMLGGAGFSEEPVRGYAGLSDASAVPVVDEHGFEPIAPADVPVEPEPEAPAEPDALIPDPAAAERKPARRKRASVPSWDEIMFGGPKPGS